MSKIASVKLGWSRSPSADVTSRKLVITKDGEEETIELGPEVESYVLDVAARSSVSFKTIVVDEEGNEVESSIYSFALGDLEAPQPDTDLFHEVVGVRDADDEDPEAPPA